MDKKYYILILGIEKPLIRIRNGKALNIYKLHYFGHEYGIDVIVCYLKISYTDKKI